MTTPNPYTSALEMVKQHAGTSGQTGLAKCILSLYNSNHAFSIGDILGSLDERYTHAVLALVTEYAYHGETADLRRAGEWCYDNFPGLIELSCAMSNARSEVRQKWEEEREAENRRLYPEEYR